MTPEEQRFKDWFFKNCVDRGYSPALSKVNLAPYDLYKKVWNYFASEPEQNNDAILSRSELKTIIK